MSRERLILRPLQVGDEPSLRRAVDEFQADDPEWDFAFHYDPMVPFTEYIEMVAAWPSGRRLPRLFVPNTYLVGVIDDVIVGRVSVRHELNEFLRTIGGHIGYGVVPSWRRRGIATELLRQALPVAAQLGLDRVLVTCDEDNLGSRKVIERNGGVLEDIVPNPKSPMPKMRYWIETRSASKR